MKKTAPKSKISKKRPSAKKSSLVLQKASPERGRKKTLPSATPIYPSSAPTLLHKIIKGIKAFFIKCFGTKTL